MPDLDGLARIEVTSSESGEMIACVEAPLSNGKTVDQHGVGWTTAVVAGLGLVASAVTSGLGHSNTAAHVAANAVSLFGYFQALAMIGMTAVHLPPIVSAWTQNFDWAMGIIEIGFTQDIFHWYIQATGGTPANLLGRLSEVSVQITKRSIDVAAEVPYMMTRAAMYGFAEITPDYVENSGLVRRSNNIDNGAESQPEIITVAGINRVAFKAKIEETNFFMTGLGFFVAFLVFTALGVSAFKGACEFAIRMKWIRGTKFQDFRNGWLTVLKGIMYRCVCAPSSVVGRFIAYLALGADRIPANVDSLSVGTDGPRFCRSCCSRNLLLLLHDWYPGMGIFQSNSHRPAFGVIAQKPGIYLIF